MMCIVNKKYIWCNGHFITILSTCKKHCNTRIYNPLNASFTHASDVPVGVQHTPILKNSPLLTFISDSVIISQTSATWKCFELFCHCELLWRLVQINSKAFPQIVRSACNCISDFIKFRETFVSNRINCQTYCTHILYADRCHSEQCSYEYIYSFMRLYQAFPGICYSYFFPHSNPLLCLPWDKATRSCIFKSVWFMDFYE